MPSAVSNRIVPDWPGLAGPPPDDPFVNLAERLTGTLVELEVVRLLAEEIERRVRPQHWFLLLGDRDELRVEHIGGQASARLLRTRFTSSSGAIRRALDTFEGQVILNPSPEDIEGLEAEVSAPADLVVIPFGGYEVVGCLVMSEVLQFGPSAEDLAALRQALRLGAIGIRNARRHAQRIGGDAVDLVTGLAGPNQFRAALQTELERAKRTQRSTAVILVDLDHFKRVNEAHGRLVGTSLLAEVGAVLQLSIRRVDLASRWCGDTFAVLLPETDRSGVVKVATRIQERLRTARFDVGLDSPLSLTGSVGIVLFEGDVQDPDRRLHDAELLMRNAQDAGTPEAIAIAD